MDSTMEIPPKTKIRYRILAGLIDYALIYAFFLTYLFSFGTPDEEANYSIEGLPALVPVIFWFLMTIGVEIWLGATVGNTIAGLRAIPQNGRNRKLTFGESFKRHFCDVIDMSFFGLVGIITIKNTAKRQRLGDLWGRTIVVRAKDLDQPG